MEAGIEHLTRGTADSVEAFIVVIEPGQRSIQTAGVVRDMAKGLGVKNVFVVANKIRSQDDLDFVKIGIGTMELAGYISFSHSIMEADIKGGSPFNFAPQTVEEVKKIKAVIEKVLNAG